MLIDTHCHLSFKAFNDSWPDVVKRARDKNIRMICVGATKATSEKAIAIAEKSDGVFAAIGLHPTHAEAEQFDYEWFSKAADNSKVVAMGETGIDYYHLEDSSASPLSFPRPLVPAKAGKESSFNASGMDPRFALSAEAAAKAGRGDDGKRRAVTLQKQEDLLRQHLVLAKDKNLPVILHCRDLPAEASAKAGGRTPATPPLCPSSKRSGYATAYEHLYRVITDFGYTRCVLHCFGGGWNMAQKFLDLGCLVSFTGIVTYKNAGEPLRQVVRNAPLDRFMIETDSPYLAPEPYRGKQNEPAYMEHIARAIAEIRRVSYDEVAQATTENARRFFRIEVVRI